MDASEKEAVRKERILWGVLGVTAFFFGGFIGFMFGSNSGIRSAEEASWSDQCKSIGDFYVCDDLRGFDYKAVDIQFAAMELAETEVNEGLEGKRNYSFTYGVALAVRRDTKEPRLVAYYESNEKSATVVGSVPIAEILKRVEAMQDRDCPENLDECDWGRMFYVSVYDEAVEWAGKIVAQVSEKKE